MRRMLVLCAVAVLLSAGVVVSDVPPYISYQGVLRDVSGTPVPDDDYAVTFRIYDAATGGTALWTESQTLPAVGGIINASLGTVVPLEGTEFDVPYWLGISVEGEAELVPRTAFATAPYAGHAAFADHCLEGDEDWWINGNDVYHDVGNVGIGTNAPSVPLDVVAGDYTAVRFLNGCAGSGFTIRAVNNGGTAGGFFAGATPNSYPAVPAAVYGRGGETSRGGHFTSDGDVGLFASSGDDVAIWGYSSVGYSGYFSGGGQGVYVGDLLQTDAFRMTPGMAYGYVLTSDGSGYGTWQPPTALSDGDWTVASNDIYSAVSGRVGIGLTLPTAKLEVYNDTTEEALEVKYGGTTVGRAVNFERTVAPVGGQDLLQLKVPSDAPANSQLIEGEWGPVITFAVDADGSVRAEGKMTVDGSSELQAQFTTSSATDNTVALSGVCTGSAYADPVGVYGESIPLDAYGVGGEFVGGWRGVEGLVYPEGSGFRRGVYGYVESGAGTHTSYNYGVYGNAKGGYHNYGVYGEASDGELNFAGYFLGNATVTGTFYAGTKLFKIDHPLDPTNKYLLHTSVESDEMMNIYNGNVTLDASGEAVVELPDWFEALNRDFRYQLTAVGAPGPNLYVAKKISGNAFTIAGGEPGSEVSWQVTGVRHDPYAEANRTAVEQPKPADEVGKYMHPEAYGMPRTAGIGYVEEREVTTGRASMQVETPAVRDPSDGD